jgi:undecaprenyl-diphosphatase
MSWLEAIILGLVQGLSEFLPISSTAQLVTTQYLLGIHSPGYTLEIVLHLASALAVMLYYRRDLLSLAIGSGRYLRHRHAEDRPALLWVGYLGVATVITAILGLLMEKQLGDNLKHPGVVAGGLLLTALCLVWVEWGTRRVAQTAHPKTIGWKHTIIIGLAQALAVLPGISRSGATLIAGLGLGLDKATAVRFSFLLSIPVILGSSLLLLRKTDQAMLSDLGFGPLLLAFVVSFVASLGGIVWLINFVRTSRLYWFALYCAMLAGAILIWSPDFRG